MCARNGVSDISKSLEASSAMRLSWPGWYKTEGFRKNICERSAQMRRRSATTGLVVDASHVLQETVSVLSNPEQGVAMVVSGHTSSRVAL